MAYENIDPFGPWRRPIDWSDPFAPWNSPIYRNDPFAPWNVPLAGEKEYNKYLADNYLDGPPY